MDKGPIKIEWFIGAETNICYNALDRHVKEGRGDKVQTQRLLLFARGAPQAVANRCCVALRAYALLKLFPANAVIPPCSKLCGTCQHASRR